MALSTDTAPENRFSRHRPTGPEDLAGGHWPVVVVGGGQAGLSMSRCLQRRGVDHVVLERAVVAHSWKTYRWDTFCLVTPNWQCQLPDFPYAGEDPHGFMVRDQIVDYLEAYRAFVEPPIVEGVEVRRLARDDRGTYRVTTTAGELTADQVVVATGGYHTPITPPMSQPLPAEIAQVQSQDDKSGAQLPPRRGPRRGLGPVRRADRGGPAPRGPAGPPRGR